MALAREGGIELISDSDRYQFDNPDQVRCEGCGLEVERERLCPGFDMDAFLSGKEFKITIHD